MKELFAVRDERGRLATASNGDVVYFNYKFMAKMGRDILKKVYPKKDFHVTRGPDHRKGESK